MTTNYPTVPGVDGRPLKDKLMALRTTRTQVGNELVAPPSAEELRAANEVALFRKGGDGKLGQLGPSELPWNPRVFG